ncbi:MAG TPA: hypothetical protein VKH82_19035 [Candidatus Binatia bacterium]|nr:hypothetical protein [Candidatus Binatia bacterium]
MAMRLIIDGSHEGLEHAPGYYRTFPHEPSPAGDLDLQGVPTTVMKTPSVETALDEMINAGQGATVMLVCHAWNNGLLLDWTPGSDSPAVRQSMETMEKLIGFETEAAQIPTQPEPARGDAWAKLLNEISPGSVTPPITASEGEAAYLKWLDAQATAFKMPGRPPHARLRRLIGKIRSVRALELERVELRACNIGDNNDSMKAVRRFFGCKKLLAPSAETFFVGPTSVFPMHYLADYFLRGGKEPSVVKERGILRIRDRIPLPHGQNPFVNYYDVLATLHRATTRMFYSKIPDTTNRWAVRHTKDADIAYLLPRTPELFAVRIIQTSPFTYQCPWMAVISDSLTALTNWAKVREFVANDIMSGSSYREGALPLAGFWLVGRDEPPVSEWPAESKDLPFVLPNEPGYLQRIKSEPEPAKKASTP